VAAYQEIRFDIRPFGGSARELVPVVSARTLADLAAAFETDQGFTPAGRYMGLVLDYYDFGDLTRYLTGVEESWEGDQVQLLSCSCGEWGCWPLVASVTVTPGTVMWSGFRNPHRDDRDYSLFGPFTFRAADYHAAASSAAAAARAASPPAGGG
jgi:hypothetical protein